MYDLDAKQERVWSRPASSAEDSAAVARLHLVARQQVDRVCQRRASSRCAMYMWSRQPAARRTRSAFLANTNVNAIQWSPDGKFMLYETSQRTETPQVARIDLTPAQPNYAEEKFDDLFKPEPPAAAAAAAANAEAKPPVKPSRSISTTSSRAFRCCPIGLNVNQPQISPDGKSLLFSAARGRADEPLSLSAR